MVTRGNLHDDFFPPCRLPDDIWMVDLDSNKLTPARVDADLPMLPEPEGTILKNHLKQVTASSVSFTAIFGHEFLLQFAQFHHDSMTKESPHRPIGLFELNKTFSRSSSRFTQHSRCSCSLNVPTEIELRDADDVISVYDRWRLVSTQNLI